jgi:O-antigen/teichoic acid export membrane protein
MQKFPGFGLFKGRDSHFGELLKGSSTAFIVRLLGMGAGYVFTILITKGYGPAAMGVFAISQTVLLILAIVARLGLDTAALRFVAEYSAQGKWDFVKEVYVKSLKIMVPLSILLAIGLYFAAPFVAERLFKKPHLTSAFRITSLSLTPFAILSLNSESLRGLKKIVDYAFFRNVSVPLVASVLLGVALYLSKDSQMPLIAYILGIIILSIWSTFKWCNLEDVSRSTGGNGMSYWSLLSVSVPMLLSSSMLFLAHWTDTIILAMFRTEAEVGIYNVALKVAAFTGITLFAINSISAPKFAQFHGNGDLPGLGRFAQQCTRLIFWTTLPVLLAFMCFPSLVLGLFGPQFKAGSTPLMILTVGQFVNAISGSVGFILLMTGREKIFQNIVIIGTLINVILNLLLVPRYGMTGAAVANMVALAFWNLGSVVYLKYTLNITTMYVPFLVKSNS